MFDIGGWEFLVIAVLAIVIIGPKDLPTTVRTLTRWVRRARDLASEFRSGLDEVAREVELDEIKNTVGLDDITGGNSIQEKLEKAMDPDGEVTAAFKDADGFLGDPMGGADGDREDVDEDPYADLDDGFEDDLEAEFDDDDDDDKDKDKDKDEDEAEKDAVVTEAEAEAEAETGAPPPDEKTGT